MAKRKRTTQTKVRSVTKTVTPVQNLVVHEMNVMSADRSYKDIGEFKNALQSAESVYYPNNTRLFDLYEDIMLDGYLSGIISKRIDSVLNKQLRYRSADKKEVEEMDQVIESEAFRNVLSEILNSKMYGLTGLEFIPGEELAYKLIPRKHIKIKTKSLVREQSELDGFTYDGISNLWVIGNEGDLGLLLKCSMYAIYKRGTVGDWAQYIEIFGQPVRIIYYDAYDTKTKEEVRKVLDESGSSLAMMIPKQAQFDMKDGKQSNGNGELQEKFRAMCNEEMGIVILGNTETTSSSKSSGYAQSKEHGKQQLEITKSDLKFALNFLNSKKFFGILKTYGLPVQEGARFEFEKEINLEEIKIKAEIQAIVKTTYNVPVADDYVYETFGISKPDNYDELKKKQEEQAQAIAQPPAPDAPTPPTGKPKNKAPIAPEKKNLQSDQFLFKFRAFLADFFDPAP